MAAEGQEISVKISAAVQGLIDGMKQASDSVAKTSASIQGSFTKMENGVKQVTAAFATITAVLAGGKMFKEAIQSTIDWTMEVNKLSKVMRLNLEDASAWAVAIHTIGISGDSLVSLVGRLQVRILSNQDAFNKWGVTIKNARGGMLPMSEVLLNMADRYEELKKKGQENNMLAEVGGRNWTAYLGVMRMTRERLKEAADEAAAFGLVVGKDGVAQAREYNEAMNKMGLIAKGFANAVGHELVPILKDVAKWFGESGPQAFNIFLGVMKTLYTSFMLLKNGIETLTTIASALILDLAQGIVSIGSAIAQAFKGDFAGAGLTLKQAAKDSEIAWKAAGDVIAKDWSNTYDKIKNKWFGQDAWMKKSPGGVAESDETPQAGTKNRMKEWEEALANREAFDSKMAAKDGMFYEKSLEEERKFWQEKLALTEKGSDEETAVKRKLDQISLQNDKNRLEKVKANLETQLADEKTNLANREAIQVRVRDMYAQGTKQWEAEERKRVQIHREAEDEIRRLTELRMQAEDALRTHELDMESENINTRKEMGIIDAQQALQAEIANEEARYQVKLAAARRELALNSLKETPEKVRERLNQIAALEQAHETKMAQLDRQLTMVRVNNFREWFDGLTSGFNAAMQGLIKGTMSWGQAFKSIMGSALDFTIQMFTQMGLNFIKTKIIEMIWGKTAAASQITAGAGMAAVNAMASVAAIPVVGWAMAPEVGASTFATAMAYMGTLASAAGGWDTVPSDQLAQIHKGEMVMSAPLAQGLRDIIKNGQTGTSGGSGDHYSVQIHAMDSHSFTDALRRNQTGMLKVMKEAARNGRA